VSSSSSRSIPEADVHGYVDGQLSPERRARVEAAVAADADLAQRVASMHEQNAALRDVLDPVLDEAIPARLLAAAAMPPTGSLPRPPPRPDRNHG